MNVTLMLQSTAYIPALSARPFLAAFLVAIIAAFGPIYGPEWQSNTIWGLQIAPSAPDWFTNYWSLTIMGALAVAEIFALKMEDVRFALEQVDIIIKGFVTLVVTFALIDAETAGFLASFANVSPVPMLSLAWLGFTNVLVWVIATIRAGFFRLLSELDEGDDLGLQGALLWLEDMGVGFGVILATILPLLTLIIFAIVVLSLWLIQIYFNHKEAQNRLACSACQKPIHPAALICHHCNQPNQTPYQVGAFGQTKPAISADRVQHQLQLLVRKRCPKCANRLPKKQLQQTCLACGKVTFASPKAVNAYIRALQPTLGKTMVICFLLGSIPVFGLFPGLVYYRLSLISSLRGYIPRRSSFMIRWGIRLFNACLLTLQSVPFLGSLMLPILCYSNFKMYQGALQREQRRLKPIAPPRLPSQPKKSLLKGTMVSGKN